MGRPSRHASQRLASVWVALGLAVIAAALSIYALDERNTAAVVRSFVLPGSGQVPDTGVYDGAATAAGLEAAVAVVLAAAVVPFSGRATFMFSAFSSILTVGTGVWIAIGSEPRLPSVQVGPIGTSMAIVDVALMLAAALCLAGSIVGWFTLPPEPRVARPPMPPPTHQG